MWSALILIAFPLGVFVPSPFVIEHGQAELAHGTHHPSPHPWGAGSPRADAVPPLPLGYPNNAQADR